MIAIDKLLVSCPNKGGLVLVQNESVEIIDRLSTTGVAYTKGRLFRAFQRDALPLGVFTDHLELFTGLGCCDLHDLLIHNETLYIVSTGSSEIILTNFKGEEKLRWSFPGLGDAWHVNCIGFWNDIPVVSAFGTFPHHRGYDGNTENAGVVVSASTGDFLVKGLHQPHTLFSCDGRLFYCDSMRFQLYVIGNGICQLQFDGYTRGAAVGKELIYLGLSSKRHAEPDHIPISAKVVALDRRTLTQVDEIEIPFREIYGIEIINEAEPKEIDQWRVEWSS